MSHAVKIYSESELKQGSPEWLSLRTTKITSTDAAVIMGVNTRKTKAQLYKEKVSQEFNMFVNDDMKRGKDLEPIARELFTIQNGIEMFPRVVIKDWTLASLDGMSDCRQYILEIKCPKEKNHSLALQGKVPEYYYPQLQHALYVTGLDSIFYYSFDGTDGVTLIVKRDEKYIEKMVAEERKFYDCIINQIPPESDETEYVQREDYLWVQCANEWRCVKDQLDQLERQEKDLRDQLIFLGAESNSRGAGVSLCQVTRKGQIDYSGVPELKNVDLEKHRKPETKCWRITAQ